MTDPLVQASPEQTAADPEAHLREQRLGSESVWRGGFLNVRRDRVRLPDGRIANREYLVHAGAVMIVPICDDGRLVVERQWRYPLERAFIEFPAGKLDAGEPGFDCAVRELAEETGYQAREWARAGVLHNAIAYSTEGIEIWFARGLVAGEARLEAGEFLEVQFSTLEALEAQAAAGELSDAKTLIGLLWLRHWREGRWALDWQSHEIEGACP